MSKIQPATAITANVADLGCNLAGVFLCTGIFYLKYSKNSD